MEQILLKHMDLGTIVFDSKSKYSDLPIYWVVAAHNHYKDDENIEIKDHTTLVAKDIISLKSFDFPEDENINISRSLYGNNRYAYSNLRQWLNSEGDEWYLKAHKYDSPPLENMEHKTSRGYMSEPGFLSHISTGLKERIIPTKIKTLLTPSDGVGFDVTTDSVFLLSKTEISNIHEGRLREGSFIPYFDSAAKRRAKPSIYLVDQLRERNSKYNNDNGWFFWLRTPFFGRNNSVRDVTSTGLIRSASAKDGFYGVRPVINIDSNMEVSMINSDVYQLEVLDGE